MKKYLLVAVVTLAGVVSGFAQGTVTFANGTATLIRYTTDVSFLKPSDIALAGSALPVGAAWSAALYSGPTGSTVDALAMIGAVVNISPVAGRVNAGTRTTAATTAPGASGLFQIRIWETANGNSYESAYGKGYQGVSQMVTSATGGAGTPPGAAVALNTQLIPFGSIYVAQVPEPASAAILGLGMASLLIFRRRK